MKLILSMLAIVMLSSAVAVASDSTNETPESKENQTFEAQGHNNAAKALWNGLKYLFNAFVENTDGTLTVSDSFISSTMGNMQQINVSLESRIYGIKEVGISGNKPDVEWAPGSLIVPIEVRVTANINDPSKIDLTNFKVGVVRMLMEKYSLTIQGLSYFYHKNEIGLGSYDGFEIANVTFSDVTDLSKGGNVELVYKVTMGIGLSGMYSNPARDAAYQAQAQQGDTRYTGVDAGLYLTSGGSVGFRFYKKVLVDVFGGYNFVGDSKSFDYMNENGAWIDSNGATFYGANAHLKEAYYGAGLRYTPHKNFSARVSLQRNSYSSWAGFSVPNGARASDDEHATTVMGAIEARW